MDVNNTIVASLEAIAESMRQAHLANQLDRQARQAISDRAQILAEQSTEYVKYAGIAYKVAKRWVSPSQIVHCILVDEHLGQVTVLSITETPNQPSSRPHSVQRLKLIPLGHLAEHFGPLMQPDFASV